MKLFVFNSPYSVVYGSCCIYCIAPDLETAKGLAMKAALSEYGYDPNGETISIDPIGEPTRIVEGPYAECYQWSE